MTLLLIGLLIELTAIFRGLFMIRKQGGVAFPTGILLTGSAAVGFVIFTIGGLTI